MASSDSEGETYEVAEILDSRKKGRSTEFLVRWKGFGEAEDSWEPEKNLKRSADMVAAFKKKQSPARSKSRGRSQSRSRSKGRSASRGRSKSKGRSSSRSRQTKTTTTTMKKTETKKTVAETPSPVTSPRRSGRRLLQSEIESSSKAAQQIIRESSTRVTRSMQQKQEQSMSRGFVKTMKHDIPIVILVSCLLFIAVSFAVQNLK